MRHKDAAPITSLLAKHRTDSDSNLSTTSNVEATPSTTSYFSQELSPFDDQQEEEFQEDFLAYGVCLYSWLQNFIAL